MMRMMMAAMVLMAMLGGTMLARADVTVAPILTMKDAQDDFAAARYQDCLKKITSVLGLSTTTPADRAALLLLRAECMLAQKQGAMASDAFSAASIAYVAAKDHKGAATAKTTSILIRSSQDFAYTPKTGADKTPLPIIDQAKRPAALTAMFNDQLAAAQDTYKALQAKVALPDILIFAPKVQDLDGLEVAASGDDKQTVTMQKGLAGLVKNAIDAFLAASGKKADTIAASAATMVNVPMPAPSAGAYGRPRGNVQQPQQKKEKGLTDADRTTLNGLLSDVAKIEPSAKNLVTALNVDADYFKTDVTNAATLKKKIEAILGGNFKPGG